MPTLATPPAAPAVCPPSRFFSVYVRDDADPESLARLRRLFDVEPRPFGPGRPLPGAHRLLFPLKAWADASALSAALDDEPDVASYRLYRLGPYRQASPGAAAG